METGTSGYFDIPGNWGFTIRIYWSEVYDINSNQSTVTITRAQAMSSNWYGVTYYMNGTISVAGTTVVTMRSGQGTHALRINGQNIFYDITGSPAAPWSVGSIKHDDDGTKAITISVSLTGYTTSGNYGNGWSASGSTIISLTAIPRKSSLSTGNGTLGETQTISVTKKLSDYTHTISYRCGSVSEVICTKSSETSIEWTAPIELAQQNTTGTSVAVVLTIETFHGDTSLGSEAVTISCDIPETVVPSASLIVVDALEYLNDYGSYIQNKSRAWVKAAGTGVYGAVIKSYTIVCGSFSRTGSSGVFDLPQSGTVTITVTVTDSRGRSASASTTIEVTAYSAPTAEITSRYRCDADGNEDYLGTYAIAFFKAAVTSLGGKNSASYALKYRTRGTAAWTSIALTGLTGHYAPSGVSQIFPAGIDKSYDVCIAVTDNFGTVESAYRTVQLGSPIMDIDRDHRSLAFFQRAVDADTVAFGLPAKFNAGVTAVFTMANTEAELEEWLESVVIAMEDRTIKPVAFYCAAFGDTVWGAILFKATAHYVTLFAFDAGNNICIKSMSLSGWSTWRKLHSGADIDVFAIDDGNGNITIVSTDVTASEDGAGNISLMSGRLKASDDGNGNITLSFV